MKNKNIFFSYFLLTAILISCNNTRTQHDQGTNSPQNPNNSINKIILLPEGFIPKYKILKTEDLSYNGINRKQLRISVPSSLTKTEIENNIKSVVLNFYNKNKPDGISVLVYEQGDNIESAYTVAMGEFAPYGQWEKIGKNIPLNVYKMNIKYREAYFKPKEKIISKGSIIILYNEEEWDKKQKKFVKATKVSLSNSAREWDENNIIIRVPNNTKAKVLEIYKEKLADGSEFVRYKVETTINGKKYIGWINSEEIKK